MINILQIAYAFLMGRKVWFKLNYLMYHFGLRGMGVLNYQNEYLSGESYWVKKYLLKKDRPLVLDVGANVGRYTLNVLRANKTSTILAFEPHPKTFGVLKDNVKETDVNVYNLGAGDKEGVLKLFDYKMRNGSTHASLYRSVIEDLHKGDVISQEVRVVKLDDFLSEHDIDQVDLLKIDTEGNEFKVLLGAKKYLSARKIKAIQFEFNEMNAISKVFFRDFWTLLQDYDFFRILPGGALLHIKNYSPVLCEIYAFQNIVAVLKKEYW